MLDWHLHPVQALHEDATHAAVSIAPVDFQSTGLPAPASQPQGSASPTDTMQTRVHIDDNAGAQSPLSFATEPLESIPFAPRALPAQIPTEHSPSAVTVQPQPQKAALHGALQCSVSPPSASDNTPAGAAEPVLEKGDEAPEGLSHSQSSSRQGDMPASNPAPSAEEVGAQQASEPASTGQAQPLQHRQPLLPASSSAAAAAVAAAISAAAAAAEEGQGGGAPSGSHGAHAP